MSGSIKPGDFSRGKAGISFEPYIESSGCTYSNLFPAFRAHSWGPWMQQD